jgi:hypothetical protein
MVNPVTGSYFPDRLVASFVGFVPAEDPKFVILVVLYDVPHGHFGGLVAAPVFSHIASDALQRMAVAPMQAPVESASLLPVGDSLGFFSSSGKNDDESDLSSSDRHTASGPAARPSTSVGRDDSRDGGQRIPDFRGLSLRSAFALARSYQLELQVQGDGYVVTQEPGPGIVARPGGLPNPAGRQSSVQLVLSASDEGADGTLVRENSAGRESIARTSLEGTSSPATLRSKKTTLRSAVVGRQSERPSHRHVPSIRVL